jgi:tuftelin-interacting protein 11
MEFGDDDENDYYPVGKFHAHSSSDDEMDLNSRKSKIKRGKRKGMLSCNDSPDMSDNDGSIHNWDDRTTSSTNDSSDDDGGLLIKKKKVRSEDKRDENIYGVFNNKDDTYYSQKNKLGKNKTAQPVHFVPSSTTTETANEEGKGDNKISAMEDANARFYALLSRDWGDGDTGLKKDLSANITSTDNATTGSTDEVPGVQPLNSNLSSVGLPRMLKAKTTAANDRDFGKWEKHTKGIGSKLLAKMGYQGSGGLGSKRRRASNSDAAAATTGTIGGVSRPVEVVVRPTYLGLGYGNFQEASSLKVNKQIEAELQGKPITHDKDESSTSMHEKAFDRTAFLDKKKFHKWTSTMKSSSRQWDVEKKKKKQHMPEEAFITKIIDMRSPSSSTTSFAAPPPKLGQELLYNVNLLLQSIDSKANTCNDSISYAKLKLQTIEEDLESLNNNLQSISQKRQRLQVIVNSIQDIQAKINLFCSSNDVDDMRIVNDLQEMFSKFKSNFSQDYEALQLEQILIQLISPWVEYGLTKAWDDPLKKPHHVALFIEQWRKILGCEKNSMALLILVSKYLIPKLQRAFGGPWDVIESSQPALSLFESCRTALAAVTSTADDEDDIHQELGITSNVQKSLTAILNDIIVPKLLRAVTSSWKPPSLRDLGKDSSSSVLPTHEWLLPWIRYLNNDDSMKSTLTKEVFRKFRNIFLKSNNANNSMAKWHSISDISIRMLLPWKGVVDDPTMEGLIREAIVPQLALLLTTKLEINPSDQDFSPIQIVFSWHDAGLLRTFHFICLLEGAFFLPWAKALHLWLSSETANMEEVAQFYLRWKSLIPLSVVSDNVICRYLFCGLSMIDAALKKDFIALNKLKPPSLSINNNSLAFYAKVVSRRVKEQQQLQEQQRSLQQEKEELAMAQRKMKYEAEVMPEYIFEKTSFREVVQDFAQLHDLVFQPKTSGANSSTKDGKQVFYFGSVPIYFDSDVAFAWLEDAKTWEAKSLEQLLELNKK